MRISPLAIVYGSQLARELGNNNSTELHDQPRVSDELVDCMYVGVKAAIMATHTHSLAVDGSFVLAFAGGLLMQGDAFVIKEYGAQLRAGLLRETFGELADELVRALLSLLCAQARNLQIRNSIVDVGKILEVLYNKMTIQGNSNVELVNAFTKVDKLVADNPMGNWSSNPGGALFEDGFRMKASDSIKVVLFAFCRWHRWPESALTHTISLGGDTDTIASMTGGLIGAAENCMTAWIPPHLINELENSMTDGPGNTPNGRDFVLELAEKLVSEVDGTTIVNAFGE